MLGRHYVRECRDQSVLVLFQLLKLDGRQLTIQGRQITLHTQGVPVVAYTPDWRARLLAVISDPNVAYILMLLGIYGLFFELWNPGYVLPGVVGGICLLLALYAFQVLPINYVGLFLILLSIGFFVAEIKVTSYGLLTVGGIIAFVLGSMILIDSPLPGGGIPMATIGGSVLFILGFVFIVMDYIASQEKLDHLVLVDAGRATSEALRRARIAAEQAVASPLLEDVNLAGARGVLVNITASSTVKMKEIHEVMNTIKGFTADEATVIVGQVLDDSMDDALRVTMVATGLGNPLARQNQKPMQIIRTGTDDAPMMVSGHSEEVPNVMTSRRSRTIQAMTDSGIDTLDIPAFLRRQAD